jgi:hypothetical protein
MEAVCFSCFGPWCLETTTCNPIAMVFGKSDFQLFNLQSAGGRVVNIHIWCQHQPHLVQDRGLVAHSVADHIDLFVMVYVGRNDLQESHKLVDRVAQYRLSGHLPGSCIQCCIKAKCSILSVFKYVTLVASEKNWQLSVLADQSLNNCLFIQTENVGIFGWLKIHANDQGHLKPKDRVIRDHMGLQVGETFTELGLQRAIDYRSFELDDGTNGRESNRGIGPCPTVDRAVVPTQRQANINSLGFLVATQHATSPSSEGSIALLFVQHALQLRYFLFFQFQRRDCFRYSGHTENIINLKYFGTLQ